MTAATPDPVSVPDTKIDPAALDTVVREVEEAYIKSHSSTAKKTGLSASNTTEGKNEAINQ